MDILYNIFYIYIYVIGYNSTIYFEIHMLQKYRYHVEKFAVVIFFKSKVLCILHVNMLIIIILEVLGSIVWSVNSNRIYIHFLVSYKHGNVHSLAECSLCIRYWSISPSWAFKKCPCPLNAYFPCWWWNCSQLSLCHHGELRLSQDNLNNPHI